MLENLLSEAAEMAESLFAPVCATRAEAHQAVLLLPKYAPRDDTAHHSSPQWTRLKALAAECGLQCGDEIRTVLCAGVPDHAVAVEFIVLPAAAAAHFDLTPRSRSRSASASPPLEPIPSPAKPRRSLSSTYSGTTLSFNTTWPLEEPLHAAHALAESHSADDADSLAIDWREEADRDAIATADGRSAKRGRWA